MHATDAAAAPEVGEFIEIPAWRTSGQVIAVEPSDLGSERAVRVLLQERPEQPVASCRWYRLEPGEYAFV